MEIQYLIFGMFWIVCGIISYGYQFAYYQREYPIKAKRDYKKDVMVSIFFSLFGPINILSIIMRHEYENGIKFK